jgi:hypothetical protein
VGNATSISLFSRKPIITLRDLFVMFLDVSMLLVRNMTLALTLQVTIGGKFVPFLKTLDREVVVRRSLFSKSWA